MKANLYICGPANGSVAYSFPQFQKAADDSLFLPSSECELSERQIVFRLNRLFANGVPTLRVGVYKQIFEQGMNRLGHSFGAVFQFTNDAPHGQVLAHTLIELLSAIEQRCVAASHFCSSERFSDFLSKEIQPSYDGIIDQLNPSSTSSIVAIQLASGQGLQYFTEAQTNSAEQVGALFEGFASDPSAVLCETLLIGAQIKTGRTFSPLQIEKVAHATTIHLYKIASSLQLASNDAVRNIKEGQSTIAALQRDINHLDIQLARSQLERQSAMDNASLLKRELELLRSDAHSIVRVPISPPQTLTSQIPPFIQVPLKLNTGHVNYSSGQGQNQSTFDRQQVPCRQDIQINGDAWLNKVIDEQATNKAGGSINSSVVKRRRIKWFRDPEYHFYALILFLLSMVCLVAYFLLIPMRS